MGYGGAIKGLYGVGENPQHITLETGYNKFSVKNLPSSLKAITRQYPYISATVLGSEGLSLKASLDSPSTTLRVPVPKVVLKVAKPLSAGHWEQAIFLNLWSLMFAIKILSRVQIHM